MLDDKVEYLWLDGQLCSPEDARVSIFTHTLHYGLGIFEGLRAYPSTSGPHIFQLKAHTERLLNSAALVQMTLPYDLDALMAAQCAVLKKTGLDAAYIRPMAFYGHEHLGLQTGPLSVHVMIAAWPWGAYFSGDQRERGIDVCLSSYRRHDHRSVPCKAKANGLYVNSILSLQEANKKGCQEALLLDVDGFVAEGSSANVFVVKDGIIYTPHSAHILDGITRQSICQIAQALGFVVNHQMLILDDIITADEMFFSGTAVEIAPVATFEGKKIGQGKIGPITQQLYERFSKIVLGEDSMYKHWLTQI